MKTILILIGIIIITGLSIFWMVKTDEDEIKKWAIGEGLEVKSIEIHLTIINTPFYYLTKGNHIYEVDMTNGEKWWVRTSFFGNDYEKNK